MASTSQSKSAAVRARLTHPVIDSDGHLGEYLPVLREYFRPRPAGKIADAGFGRAFGQDLPEH